MTSNLRRSRFLFLSGMLLWLWATPSTAEVTGEAKESRLNAMKEVQDGNPILRANMMNHIMQAQMYRAQMNFPMAAEEDMKAQMLQQQISQNDSSKDQNEKQKDKVVYSSDPAQAQLRGTAPTPGQNKVRQEATASNGEPWSPKSSAILEFDEGVSKEAAPSAAAKKNAALNDIELPESAAAIPASVQSAAIGGALPLSENANKVLSPSVFQAFAQIEKDYRAQTGVPTASEPAASPINTELPLVTATEFPTGLPALGKVQLTAEMKKLQAAKKKEKDDFWKSKKPKKKALGRGSKKRRQEAKTKQSTLAFGKD